MKTLHTKGEWVWFYNKYYHEVRGFNALSPNIAIFKNTREDHQKFDDIDICEHEEAEANAKLIAAAPDLLEACELAIVELTSNYKRLGFTTSNVITALESAIKKTI